MSRAQYIAECQEAAWYFQQFIRSKSSGYKELANGTNPNEGWGRSNEAREAHSIAITLYSFTDENFKNCSFPSDYGSPQEFQNRVSELAAMLSSDKERLEEALRRLRQDAPLTVGMVLVNVDSCLLAAEETLFQLAAASQTAGTTRVEVAAIPSPIDKVQEIANRFSDVVRTMSKRRGGKDAIAIDNEYDVQYLFEGLLAVPFQDVRPEEPTRSVAGGAGRADTFLKDERIMIEYKCTRSGLEAKELRKQIADDFLLYGSDGRCDRLFIFVYDRENRVRNRTGFVNDLTRKVEGLEEVRIVVDD